MSNIIDINSLPSIQSSVKNEVKFRGPVESKAYNKLQEDLFFDLSNMFNVVNDFNTRLQQTSEYNVVDKTFTQLRLKDLQDKLKQTLADLDSYKTKSDQRRILLFPNDCYIEDGEPTPASINKKYDQVSLPCNTSISKLYLYDDVSKVVTVPSTLKVNLSPVADSINIIDNDFKNAINGVANDYWVRKVISKDAGYADVSIELALPDNIISSRDVNVIQFSPYPYSSLQVLSVEYQLNGDWKPIQGFETYKGVVMTTTTDIMGNTVKDYHIDDAENIKLCFNKTAMGKIRLKLRQNTYVEENGQRVFYIGLKSLDVNCEAVNIDSANFTVDINFLDDNPRILTGIIPYFDNDSILSDTNADKKSLINYELYARNTNGGLDYIKSTFPVLTDKQNYVLRIKLFYDSKADVNPSLYNLEVLYKNVITNNA